MKHHEKKFADLRERLYVSSMVGQDAVLAALAGKSGKIEPTALYDTMLEMVADIKPVSITIASSANVFAGREIDRSQVQQFVALLTKLAVVAGGSLILVSHPSLAGISTDTGLSGSTQWHNAVRSRYFIKGVKSENGEPQGDLRVIEFRKNNYGPITSQIVVKYANGMFVPANTTVDQAAHDAQADDVYLAVMRTLTDQGQGPFSPVRNSPSYAAAVISAHPTARPFTKKDMEQAQQRLLDANQIHVEDHGSPSRPAKRIVLGPRPANEVDPM